MVIFLCLLSVCLRNDIWIALFTLSHKTYIFLLTRCQLQEQEVWERMEGGEPGGELLFWGHSRGKVPCNSAGPKARQQTFSWALSFSQKASQLLILPWLHQNEEAACTDVTLGRISAKWGSQNLCSYQKTNCEVISSGYALCCPSQSPAPAASLMPNSFDPALPQQAGDATGRGLPSAWVKTEFTWSLAWTPTWSLFLHSDFREDFVMFEMSFPFQTHLGGMHTSLGEDWVQVGGWWDTTCLISLGNKVKKTCPPPCSTALLN